MKEQSKNQNVIHVIDSVWKTERWKTFGWKDKLQIPRNFSSIDFVIKPGNDGFSNYEQSPSNDSWGDETHSLDRTGHFGQIFHNWKR